MIEKNSESPVNALIFVHIPTHFTELVRVVELMSRSGRYRPVVLFAAMYSGVERDMQRCKAIGADVITEPDLQRFRQSNVLVRSPRGIMRIFGSVLGRVAVVFEKVARDAKSLIGHTLDAILPSRAKLGMRYVVQTIGVVASVVRNAGCVLQRIFARCAISILPLAPLLWLHEKFLVSTRWLFRCGLSWLNMPVPFLRWLSFKPQQWSLSSFFLVPLALLAWLIRLLLCPFRFILRQIPILLFGIWYRYFFALLPQDIRALHYIRQALPNLFEVYNIRLLVLPEDNFYYFTNFYVQVVHDRGGAAIVVPFTIVNMREWAEAFYKEPSYNASRLFNSVMAFLFPKWRHTHRGCVLVMPFQHILCTEYFGNAPPVPWLINSGHADAIAVESVFMQKYYLRSGIQADRLRLTGALYDDTLHHALMYASSLRRDLYARLNLRPELPMLLCALPPNQLVGAGRTECEFSDYEELLHAFLRPMRSLCGTYNCLLSLHPRIEPTAVTKLDLGLICVAAEDVAGLIPLSHIYIASCSATIRLAINCGVPVVNYDVYRYDYDDYKSIPGVVTTEEAVVYEKTVTTLCTESEAHAASARQLRDFASEHATLDGQAGARLLSLMDAVLVRDSK